MVRLLLQAVNTSKADRQIRFMNLELRDAPIRVAIGNWFPGLRMLVFIIPGPAYALRADCDAMFLTIPRFDLMNAYIQCVGGNSSAAEQGTGDSSDQDIMGLECT
jgi:hypothetical protein